VEKAIAVIQAQGRGRRAGAQQGMVTQGETGLMPRYPNVFVQVSDGKPISEIIERAETAMKRAGISSAERREFHAFVPDQYALAVDYIREFFETD
jgi:hypothetical protein